MLTVPGLSGMITIRLEPNCADCWISAPENCYWRWARMVPTKSWAHRNPRADKSNEAIRCQIRKKKMADIFEPRRALALRFTDINHVARLVLCGGSRVELAVEMATDFHDGKLYHHFPFELTSAPLPSRSPSNSKRPQFMFGAISLSFEVMLSRREYVCFHVVTTSQRRTFPGHLHKIYIK